MSNEICVGKKYKVKNARYTRTPLFINNEYVFYEHDYNGFPSCAHCRIVDFESDVEQIPEEKVKWFKVIYKRKDALRPSYCMMMFKSEYDFFDGKGFTKDDLDFFHMEEIENQLEKV